MSVRLYNTLYFNYLVPPLLTATANRQCNARDSFYSKFTLTLDTFVLSWQFCLLSIKNNGKLHLAQARYLV